VAPVVAEAVVVDADVAAAVSSPNLPLPVKNTFHRHLIRMNFFTKERGVLFTF
jgi:hypothetical protein